MAVPSAIVFVDSAFDRRVDAGLEACVQRRAVEGLGGEQFRQFADLAGGEQFARSRCGSRAGRCRRQPGMMMLSGAAKAEIFPNLIGDRFGSLQEERLPVVARVEDLAGLADRLALGFFARPFDQLHLGAIGAHLRDLGRRRIGRRQDLHAHAAGGAIGRHRRAAIARTVFEHCVDAELPHIGQHHRGAAILEAEVGLNHSSLKYGRKSSQSFCTSGVHLHRAISVLQFRPATRPGSATAIACRDRSRRGQYPVAD